MKPIVFSNGTVIPTGTMVVATTTGTHLSEELYEDAAEFKPFRFSDVRAKGGDDALRQQFHTSSPDYIPFGHGKHAWYVRNTHMIARLHWGVRRVLTRMSDSTALADSSLRTNLRQCWHTLSSTTT